MDITQLLLTAGLAVGMALVGLMAVVPTAMEVGPDPRPEVARPVGPTGKCSAPRHRWSSRLRSPAAAAAGPGRG